MERFHVLEVSAKVLFILVNIVKVRSCDNLLDCYISGLAIIAVSSLYLSPLTGAQFSPQL